MDWCKLSSGFYRDAALIRAGEAAEVLFIRALAYCAEHDTGGLVDEATLVFICPVRANSRAASLVREGLWVEVSTGFRVRSWDVWQEQADILADRRRADAERKRAKRSEDKSAGVRGTSADASANVRGESKKKSETERTTTDVVVPVDADKPRRARAITVFELTDGMRAWASNEEPAVDVDRETAKFVDHFTASGVPKKDWTAAWRNWIRNSVSRPPPGAPRQTTNAADQRAMNGLALVEKFRVQESTQRELA